MGTGHGWEKELECQKSAKGDVLFTDKQYRPSSYKSSSGKIRECACWHGYFEECRSSLVGASRPHQ